MKMCPHCGYDLIKDQPVMLNDYAMLGPTSPLTYLGQPVPLTGAERNICWTLMKAYPLPVRYDVLLDRNGSEGSDNTVEVLKCRIRKKLRAMGARDPFTTRSIKNSVKTMCWRLS